MNMALINCPECGQQISDKAITCPHCGFPIAVNSSQPVSKLPMSPKSESSKVVENTASSVSTPKIHYGKIARVLVFDNCNADIIKMAFFLAAKRVNGVDASSNNEGYTDGELEVKMNKKRIGLLYYVSTKFKSNRTITCLSENSKYEEGATSFNVPNLDLFLKEFKEAVSEIATKVTLYKESDAVDILGKYTKGHYQVIFEEEQMLITSDKDNLRTKEEEESYKKLFENKTHSNNPVYKQQSNNNKVQQENKRPNKSSHSFLYYAAFAIAYGIIQITVISPIDFGKKPTGLCERDTEIVREMVAKEQYEKAHKFLEKANDLYYSNRGVKGEAEMAYILENGVGPDKIMDVINAD